MSSKTTTWLYPTNWNGSYLGPDGEEMPYGWKRMKVNFKYYDDSANGTDEDQVVKLRRADYKGVNGDLCYMIQVDKVHSVTYGMAVDIMYDMAPNQTIVHCLEGNESKFCGPYRPDIDEVGQYGPGQTGDILFTTRNASQYDYYDITMEITIIEWPRRLV